jgi:imidazolonepropionase-like amidohydrolase
MGLDVGLIQEGYLADLLLVDGDPTAGCGDPSGQGQLRRS